MASINYMSSVPKLLGRENYEEWAFAVENFLVLDGLTKCLDGTETDNDKNLKAKAKLVLTIDASLFVHVKEAKSAKELWDKLKSLYDNSGFTRKIGLLRSLISMRLENCESMESYVKLTIETAQKLSRTGFKVDDQWTGSLLLAGLPQRFEPMIMAIEHSGIDIKTDIIKSKLLDMQFNENETGGAFASKASSHSNFKKKGGMNTNRERSDVKCYRCKQYGHFKNKCPNSSSNDQTSKNNAFNAVFLSGQFNNTDWYIDSGASVHLTARKDWLENLHHKPEISEIMIANKATIPVFFAGETNITTTVGSQKHNIKVQEVLFVPELTTNLLSVSQIIKNGNSVRFDESCCRIYNKQNILIAVADLVENVYRLNIEKSGKCLLATSAVTDIVWHRRFGHLNYSDLKLMKDGAVEGMNSKGDFGNKSVCQVCCEGKQSRLPFKHEGRRASSCLEVIHADVCGPMEKNSIGGSRYFLVFEDDFSRMTFVYFLKTKDEVINYFKEFKSLVENQKNAKIKTLRTDNGGEFCNSELEFFLKKNGIVHQKTNPYTPEQNGMCERMNRTLIEKARCLQFEAKLSKRFWAEAVNTAVYLRNRSVVSGLKTKTPYEMWTGIKPDVTDIRIFGSEVMVHIPKQKRNKWDKKANKMLLVGFGENVKGYRLYDPSRNSVITSRNVVIMENTSEEIEIIITDTDKKVNKKERDEPDSVGAGQNREEFDENSEIIIQENNENSNVTVDIEPPHELESEVPETVRRSERQVKPRIFKDYVTYASFENKSILEDPLTVEEALSRSDGEKWRQAMLEEIESFDENQAWDLTVLPENGKVVKCKWVFKKKYNSENQVRYRARLVAKGFTQRAGIDYDETFAPVVRHSTLRLLIGLSVKYDLKITHLDVTTAFLNGHLQENVYMT